MLVNQSQLIFLFLYQGTKSRFYFFGCILTVAVCKIKLKGYTFSCFCQICWRKFMTLLKKFLLTEYTN